MSAEGTNRAAYNERDVTVIDDVKMMREQPTEMNGKKEEEPVPPPFVAELHQELLEADPIKVELWTANAEINVMKKDAESLRRKLEEYDNLNELLGITQGEKESLIAELKQKCEEIDTLKVNRKKAELEWNQLRRQMELEKSREIEELKKKLDDAIKLNEELVENGADIRRNKLPILADFLEEPLLEDGVNAMEDPKEDSFNLSLNAENRNDSEVIGGENDSTKEVVERDETEHSTIATSKNSSEVEDLKKGIAPMRPRKYTVSLDESLMKLTIRSEKVTDNERGSDVDESSSKPSRKVVRKAKINHADLKCPKCDYCSRSVVGWLCHLKDLHSSSPRQLNLALLCECGSESFSDFHSRVCDVSRITIVHKSATPKCVMCEVFPKTARAYAEHLKEHGTSLKKLNMYITCACGIRVISYTNVMHRNIPKKCNGFEYTLHNVDEE